MEVSDESESAAPERAPFCVDFQRLYGLFFSFPTTAVPFTTNEPQSYVLDGRNHPLHVTMTCGERSSRLSAGSPFLPNAGRCGTVSYTHLDVYKRQRRMTSSSATPKPSIFPLCRSSVVRSSASRRSARITSIRWTSTRTTPKVYYLCIYRIPD